MREAVFFVFFVIGALIAVTWNDETTDVELARAKYPHPYECGDLVAPVDERPMVLTRAE